MSHNRNHHVAPLGSDFVKDRCRSFERFARWNSRAYGHPYAFSVAIGAIVLWAATGPIFHFSDTWQLVINTATTIITFLMVFLIQNAQNRDNMAVQLKLDEILRAVEKAHNSLVNAEELSQTELDALKKRYEFLAQKARTALQTGKSDLGCPEVTAKQKNLPARVP